MATPIAIPMASPPASRRFNASTRPEFIYTNPAAAAQAASSLQSRLGFESAQDQGYRDYLTRINESTEATNRADINAQALESQLRAYGVEGAANRASAERIAASTALDRQYRNDLAQWEETERAAEIGEQTAAMLNQDPNAKGVNRNFAWLNPQTTRWESRFARSARPVPPFNLPATGTTPALGPSTPGSIPSNQVPASPSTITVPSPGPAPMIDAPPDMAPSYGNLMESRDAQIEETLRNIFAIPGVGATERRPSPWVLDRPRTGVYPSPSLYMESDMAPQIRVPSPGPAPMRLPGAVPAPGSYPVPPPLRIPFY